MIYASQQHCIDKEINQKIKSNDMLTIFVEHITDDAETETFHCYGLLNNQDILFRSILTLLPLKSILNK